MEGCHAVVPAGGWALPLAWVVCDRAPFSLPQQAQCVSGCEQGCAAVPPVTHVPV